jgi:NAD-dependent SIR2 family protein deacetylase
METNLRESAHLAAEVIRNADAVLIGAGAGMGVDSGLPDFRGSEGFWEAYPPFKAMGLSFQDLANPDWFERDPHLAWGFYGHRLNLYRATVPHGGFQILKRLTADKNPFIFTSNVDGQFQKAGFSSLRVEECHGSIHHFQCTQGDCCTRTHGIWSADNLDITVDNTTFRAIDPLPTCPECGALARPNILMFRDAHWVEDRTLVQEQRCLTWEKGLLGNVVAIECGAGTAIPSVRRNCESFIRAHGGTLIRINVRESKGRSDSIAMPCGALAGLSMIADELGL